MPENSLAPKRTGPYLIKKVVSPLTYEVEELPQGPKIGQRYHVVNVQHLDDYLVDFEPDKEFEVEMIVKHKRRYKNVKYLVRWKDGDETWEPTRNLVDQEGSKKVINAALKKYWEKTPSLAQWERMHPGWGIL